MTSILAAIPAAFGLVFVPRILVVVALRQAKKFDNDHPRDAVNQLEGWGRRAQAAQDNGWEAFPAFAVGVLAAALTGARPELAAILCIVHLVMRGLYVAGYVGNWSSPRSLVWMIATGCTVGLMLLPVV